MFATNLLECLDGRNRSNRWTVHAFEKFEDRRFASIVFVGDHVGLTNEFQRGKTANIVMIRHVRMNGGVDSNDLNISKFFDVIRELPNFSGDFFVNRFEMPTMAAPEKRRTFRSSAREKRKRRTKARGI